MWSAVVAFLVMLFSDFDIGLNNIYSGKVYDINKYNVMVIGSDSKPMAYLDHLLEMISISTLYDILHQSICRINCHA